MDRRTWVGVVGLLTVTLLGVTGVSAAENAQTAPKQDLPRHDGRPADMTKPVKVFILMGQSNMVGMGELSGGSSRWGAEFLSPVVSVYEGAYSPSSNYDKLTPVTTKELPEFGGVNPTPFPGGGTHVVRGQIKLKAAGVYEFRPGYGGSTHNVMEIGGVEVYRNEVGKDPVSKPFTFEEGKTYPFKITYLTQEANGLGWSIRNDIPGTLETLVKQQQQYPFLLDDAGKWTVRKDVFYYDARTKHGSPLSPTSNNGATIGPELGFGYVLGQILDEPVLVLKSCIGNRSLGWDLLPPGSERYVVDGRTYAGYKDTPDSWIEGQPKNEVNWYAGKQYDEDMANAKAALENLATIYPDYQGQGYEIAGFVWWQGHKDQNPVHAGRYEQNLVRLIQCLRQDYNAPKARFVLATIAFDGWKLAEPGLTIAHAQLAVGDSQKHPEFAGNVKTVEARDFWREVAVSPANQGYHYNRNAGTYLDVGLALGWAMADLWQKND